MLTQARILFLHEAGQLGEVLPAVATVEGAGEDADGVDDVAALALDVAQLSLLHVLATHHRALFEGRQVAALLCGEDSHQSDVNFVLWDGRQQKPVLPDQANFTITNVRG